MKKNLFIVLFIWTLFIIASFIWNYKALKNQIEGVALNKSRAFFQYNVSTRAWNSGHGGVYVPVTETTKPNPYLEDSLRDIVSTEGLQLTKINPAYMTRQIAEINNKEYYIQFRITSLNPIRPKNKADEWETASLKKFEEGATEVFEKVGSNPNSRYKYMGPFYVISDCLKCHAKQGYKVGDIRGGISVTFSTNPLDKVFLSQLYPLCFIHAIVLILGMLGIVLYQRKTQTYLNRIHEKNIQLKKSNATKEKMFSIISHDLNSPFNIIQGYTDILSTQYDDYEDSQRKQLISEIDKSAKSSYNLLQDLLTWTTNQDEELEPKKIRIDIFQLIEDAIGPYKPSAILKSIETEIQCPKDTLVELDRDMIKTVLGNLYNNAIKFTPNKGNIQVVVKIQEFKFQCSIIDNGVGMSEEQQDKLFNPQHKISTQGTNYESGTGFGLLICKEIIDKHDGRLWVNSTINKGSEFSFEIPI